jgi:3-oxoadipate enol-lactonase
VLADTIAGIAIDGWFSAAAAIPPRVGAFNHPALSNEFCIRNPERAHLYLEIGGLRHAPFADQSAMLKSLGEVTYTDEEVASVQPPVLFIVGSRDEIFPPDLIAKAARRVPGAQVELIEGAGHSPYFEQPGVWNALVQEFWFPRP